MQVKLKVRRYDPEAGDGPQSARYSTYEIDVPEHATILDSLIQVRDFEDGSLALRCSCRSAICGSCSMRINGRARLACKTKTADMAKQSEEITVEPMGNMPIVKDLVSDMDSFWSKVRQIRPWLQPVGPRPEREYLATNAAMMDLARTMNCIYCGACVSDCTVLEVDKSFIAPAALAKAYRFVGDPRDGMTVERLREYSQRSGIWDCTRCNMCVEVCPKGVAPMDRIMELRQAAMNSGLTGNTGARHTKAFATSIESSGRLNEALMVPRTLGMFNVPGILREAPTALRFLRRGKLPVRQLVPPLEHKIPGISHVRRLFRKYERNEKTEVKG